MLINPFCFLAIFLNHSADAIVINCHLLSTQAQNSFAKISKSYFFATLNAKITCDSVFKVESEVDFNVVICFSVKPVVSAISENFHCLTISHIFNLCYFNK
jgi:hypothetical protein